MLGAKGYINKILTNYERLFGELPKMMSQPVETNDHPEVDTSELLDNAGIEFI